MRYLPALILPAACALVAALALTLASPAHAGEGTYNRAPYAVGLGDATSPPSRLRILRPGHHVTFAYGREGWNCTRRHDGARGWFSDVSAYTWQGYALGPQRWREGHTLATWQGKRGRVTFDGITFENHTRAPVLVAGWCE